MKRRNEVKDRQVRFAKHYGLGESQLEKGLEAYAVHLFAQEEGLDSVLEGLAWNDEDLDLSPYILHGDDLGVDGLLTDANNKRVVIIQCTTQAKDLEKKLGDFAKVVDRINNPDLVRRSGEKLQELVAGLPDNLGDEYSVELRFVLSHPLNPASRLPLAVESYNNGYDAAGQKITLELYGSAELLRLEEEFTSATTGAPIGQVCFSLQEKKTLRWSDDAPRETLVALIKGNELADLYDQYGNKLFAHNIRLPLITKNVNPEIRRTAEEEPENFFYFNNGVSAVCKKFELSGTKVTATGFQIINGAQTVDSLRKALRRNRNEKIYVLFRLTASESYGKDKNFTENVIRFNNTQNPVKDYDFFSNDPICRRQLNTDQCAATEN
ncbi:MAG TPA: AIPR family protein [Myxococcota bacterium]|nr:AIPR family protein [Myxococcota bacterium]